MIELESMIIRLLGDSSSYLDTLRQAQGETQRVASTIRIALQPLTQAFTAYEGRETTVLKLTAALEVNGRAVQSTLKDYQAWADGLATITTSSAEANLAILQHAETLGLTGDQAKRAVQNSIALAAAQGGEASSYLRIVARLETGQVGRLSLILGLEHMKEGTEKTAAAQDKLTKIFATAQAETNTAAGQIKILGNAYTSLKADLGEVVAKGVKPVVEWIIQAVTWFKHLSSEAKTNAVVVMSLFAAFVSLKPILGLLSILAGLVFTPIGIALAIATTAIIIFIHEIGGVSQAWTAIKDGAVEFYNKVIDLREVTLSWLQEFARRTKIVEIGIAFVTGVVLTIVGAVILVSSAFETVSGWVSSLSNISFDWIGQFIEGASKAVIVGSFLVGSFLAIAAAVKVAILAYGIFSGVIAFFKVLQIIQAAWWVVSTIALLAFKAVILLATVTFFAFNVLIGFSAITLAGWQALLTSSTIGILAVKVALWLASAAIAVWNALTVANILAIVVLVGVLVNIFIVVAAAVIAAFIAVNSLITALSSFPTTFGAIAHIGDLFGEWGGIIKDLVYAVQFNLPLAWKLIKLGFQLVVQEVKDLWGPLWITFKEAFSISINYVVEVFERQFDYLVYKFKREWEDIRTAGVFSEELQGNLAKYKAAVDATNKTSLEITNRQLQEAGKIFDKNFVDNAKDIREKVQAVQAEIRLGPKDGKMYADAFNLGQGLGTKVTEGFKSVKLDAALVGSAEALHRLLEYRERLRDTKNPDAPNTGIFPSPLYGSPDPGGNTTDPQSRVVDALIKIYDVLKGKEPVKVRQVDLN